eukprot:7979755-Ditylum_brightwellii.AAC.1
MERVHREEACRTRDDESVDASDNELIDDGDGDGEKGKMQQEDVDSEVNHPRDDDTLPWVIFREPQNEE